MQNRFNNLVNEIYDAYKGKVEEASSTWKSEYSCGISEDEARDVEDAEDLKYFRELLTNLQNLYEERWRC